MYERAFGTDWESLDDREDVLRRAYALGVATELGHPVADELDRLTEEVTTSYDRSFVTLAYRKGREEVRDIEVDSDTNAWQTLIDGTTELDPHEAELLGLEMGRELPEHLERISIDSRPDDHRTALRRPPLLDRFGTTGEGHARHPARRSSSDASTTDDDATDQS